MRARGGEDGEGFLQDFIISKKKYVGRIEKGGVREEGGKKRIRNE